jgi:hypothetical protein
MDRLKFEASVRASLINKPPVLQQIGIERLEGYATQAQVGLDTLNMLFEEGLTYNQITEIVLRYADGDSQRHRRE